MRAFLVAAAVIVGSCTSGPPRVQGYGYDDMGCKLTCDKCPPKALCVGAPYVPQCLQACLSDADCDAGTCAVILDPAGVRVCIGANMLMACEPVTCTNEVAQCLDANTALAPLPDFFHTCGWEPTHCDSGCDSATGKCN